VPESDPLLLEQRLSYRFTDRRLLENALHHSSFIHEQDRTDLRSNERLEFLGDAVLNLAAGHLLMRRFPEVPEGRLSRMRARLVNESQVAKLARMLELGGFIRLGKGELLSGGPNKRSILADAYEALIGAVYLDGGFDAAFRVLRAHLSPLLENMTTPALTFDYKSRLQEAVQASGGKVPEYRMVSESGPDHDKRFRVSVRVSDLCEEGVGKSKKMAEQDAARRAFERLLPEGNTENDADAEPIP
jgi:ribonuclease-3